MSEHIEIIVLTAIYIIILCIMIGAGIKLFSRKNEYKQLLEISMLKNKIEEEQIGQAKIEINDKIKSHRVSVAQFEERKNQFEERLLAQEEKIEYEKSRLESEKQNLENLKHSIDEQIKAVNLEHESNLKDYENKLLELANTTSEEAKRQLFEQLDHKYSKEINVMLRNHIDQLELEKTNIARKILLETMENIVVDTANENTVKQIKIPNDDIKGKLIGRAGRNIRSLENLLGVNVIIDDTPCVVSISSFNPVRRAMALLTIDSLVASGKINQVSIEQEVEKAVKKIEEEILEKGKDAIYRLNIVNVNIELVKVLGKLHYRSSYGQNVLDHSIECAYIATKLANELGLDPNIAARCALLHDIGKIDSLETGKSHVELGVKFAKEFGESETVVNAIAAHHGDVEPNSAYAVITIIADKMSAGRAGSRRDSFDDYMERVTSLENIAKEFTGVENAFALQGGREIRVMVQNNVIKDEDMPKLALDIKEEIEKNVTFPGIINVNIIRETRVSKQATKENLILKEYNE